MHYLDLKIQLKDFLIFSIKDIEKIDMSFHNQRLSEWQKKGYVKKICKGFYIFSDTKINEQTLFAIANHIYEPSYISLEMALSIYGLIPEAVYVITSVTSKKTRVLNSTVGNFMYKHVKPQLLFGYQIKEYNGYSYKIADVEKAFLDYLYFNSKIKDEESFESMRFNVEAFKEIINMQKFNNYLEAFENNALKKRVKKFLTYINNA